ncbi:MAG TPA: hypothetical protein VIF62_05980 [Labilithrix sp.]
MRFLYGDSAPFPLGYNFLATLEAFMTAATRIVQVESESKQIGRQIDQVAASRVKGLEALEQFHTIVMRAVQDTAQKVQHQHALDYASKVAEFALQYVDEHRRATLGANERESAQLRGENDRRVGEQRAQLDAFLKIARLPVTATKVTLRLTGDPARPHHEVRAVFDNPDGIQTAFALSPAKAPAWIQPRKVSDFVQNVSLGVGVDKSWLRGTVTPKQVLLDDFTIAQFDISEDTFELQLKKQKETLQFHVRRTEAGLGGMVEHPGVPGAESLPGTLSGTDLTHLEKLWKALRLATRELVDHKETLLAVNLDGQPVFESGLVLAFVVRLVAMFAPTVREIAKRSPNEFELTLKAETDAGRREELYLRKEVLVQKLTALSADGRQVFAPLGLDSWVPGTTTAPPSVAATPSSRPLPQS